MGAEAPSPPPDSDTSDFSPDSEKFIDPLGVLKGGPAKRVPASNGSRSQSPAKIGVTLEDVRPEIVCATDITVLPNGRTETEGSSVVSENELSDLKKRNEEVSPECDKDKSVVQSKEELIPDPLNVTLISSTDIKPAPRLSPLRKNGRKEPIKQTIKQQPSLPQSGNADSSHEKAKVSNTPIVQSDTPSLAANVAPCSVSNSGPAVIEATVISHDSSTAVQTVTITPSAQQGRPTSISTSPPKSMTQPAVTSTPQPVNPKRSQTTTEDNDVVSEKSKSTKEGAYKKEVNLKEEVSAKGIVSKQDMISKPEVVASKPEIASKQEVVNTVPVLSVECLPENNIGLSRITMSDADQAQLAIATAASIVASSIEGMSLIFFHHFFRNSILFFSPPVHIA